MPDESNNVPRLAVRTERGNEILVVDLSPGQYKTFSGDTPKETAIKIESHTDDFTIRFREKNDTHQSRRIQLGEVEIIALGDDELQDLLDLLQLVTDVMCKLHGNKK